MANLPIKRLREYDKAVASHNSAARNNDSDSGTLVPESSLEGQDDVKVSLNETKRKQSTLDRYWSKTFHRKVETVHKPTTDENASMVTVPETVKCGSSLACEVETVSNQTSCENVPVEILQETLEYGLTPDTEAAVGTLKYDSESAAASEGSATDDSSTTACDSSPEDLELGTNFEEMATICETCRDLPPLHPSDKHTVLFRPDTASEQCTIIPKPNPDHVILAETRWDNDHVRMPYSPQNKLLVNRVVIERWGKIVSSLTAAEWKSSSDIEKAILSYNKYKWDFTELHRYFQTLTEEEHDLFFSRTLPKIAELAVNLPSICTQPIPLLRKQKEASVSMSQQQAASLLANAFFCTFPSRNANYGSDDDVPRLPSINFNNLYRRASANRRSTRHAKLDCLLHYFNRVTTDMPRGTVTFHRKVLVHSPDWSVSTARLQKLHATSHGTIEDNGTGMLQVDFANKFIGGGVLDEGCVQEEIRFLICPELIVSRLITEELDANESLLVTGCERFSNYTGYGSSTRWVSDHCDSNKHDSWGRRITQIVAIDARVFHNLPSQLLDHNLQRELNKAYCGFRCEYNPLCAVATGNWGCGAFGGDLRLKALLQIMAAAEAGRPVCYFTFGDRALCRDIFQVWEAAMSANCTVGELWTYILEAAEHLHTKKSAKSIDIYQHIIVKCTSNYDSDTSEPLCLLTDAKTP